MIACYDMRINRGAEYLFGINGTRKGDRRYMLDGVVDYHVFFDDGTLHVRTEPSFVFDGRSGPRLVDWYAPNLGSLNERFGWHMHDALGYGQSLDFWHTNRALRLYLRDMCLYRPSKAWVIERAVSIDRKWYGEPKEGDWCRMNLGKVTTEWTPRVLSAA